MAKTKEEMKAYKAAWYLKNKARISVDAKVYRATSSTLKARKKAYAKKNAAEIKVKRAAHYQGHKAHNRAVHAVWLTHNPGYASAYGKDYYAANKPKLILQHQQWTADNKEHVKVVMRSWRVANPGKCSALSAKRRAALSQAVPPWITKKQLKQIEAIYIEAKRIHRQDGIPQEVDHIYPLRGKAVCGLHVPWNLRILTAVENNKKGNKLLVANRI